MIEWIKLFFKGDKKKRHVFYLPEHHRLFNRFEEFYDVIGSHLKRRDSIESYDDKLYESRKFGEYDITYYELEMLLDLYRECDYLIPLDKIGKIDTYCSGSIDYMKKFALRLAEEEESIITKLNNKTND